MEDTEKIPNEVLEMKTPKRIVKKTLDGINGRWSIAEDKINELEGIAT